MAQQLHFRGRRLPEDDVADVYVVDGRITYARPSGDVTTVSDGGWILPGLVDAHCHVGIGPSGPVESREEQEQQAIASRDGGALLIRDCGSPVDNTWMHDRPDLPKLIQCGKHLAPYKRYIPGLAIELDDDQLPEAVAAQAAAGDGWVKLVGDWIDRGIGDLAPCWSQPVLSTAIARAHELGARVTAHVFGENGLAELIEAGVDCIEHGTGLTDDTIVMMAARGTALVPTRINIDNFPSIADSASKFPVYAAHMRALHARVDETIAAAHEAGLPIYTGTDAGGMVAHGRIVDELVALRAAGLPATEVLAGASWRAREWLGRRALDEGAPADFLVLDDDPREHLETLEAPRCAVLQGVAVS